MFNINFFNWLGLLEDLNFDMSTSSDDISLIPDDTGVHARRHNTETVNENFMYASFDEGTKKTYDDFETIDWLRDVRKDSERHLRLERQRTGIKGNLMYAIDIASGWVLVFLVGISAGLLASFVDVGTTWITDLRYGICPDAFWLNKEHCCWSSSNITFDRYGVVNCPEWYDWSLLISSGNQNASIIIQSNKEYILNFTMYVLLSILFSIITVMLVKSFAPYACGSGIPEIKTILSGFIMRGFLGRWTLIVKSVGMMLATSTSLVIGKEGPFVHIGCCCGNILSYLFRKYGSNEGKKREILSAGAAVGIAVAFGAPLGGVLFSLEEISYYFPFKTLWRSFFCAMVGALVVKYVSPTARDIQFAIDYSVPWFYFELLGFATLGVIGGLWGAMYIKINSFWSNYRRNSKLRNWDVTEVVTLTFLTSFLFFPNPYTRMTMSKLIQTMVSKCTITDQTDLCDYTWKYPLESATSKLIPVDVGQGAKVPSGLMIPSMCIGAVTGRIFGIITEFIVLKYPHVFPFKYECGSLDRECVTPGLYALIGACAFLAGVTKMTVSLVVIMFEVSGGLLYIVPLMIATMIAKWTADSFVSDNKEEIRVQSVASDVLPSRTTPTSNLIYLPKSGLTLRQLVNIVESCTHAVIPIITSERTRYLYGQVLTKDLSEFVKRFQNNHSNILNEDQLIYFGCDNEIFHSDDELGTRDVINLHRIVDTAPMAVSHQEPTEILIDLFRKMGLRHAYVLHEGCLLGIITKKDIINHIQEQAKCQ
ncbi:hypothetical protein GJ496_010668 [Pomphorhynchus laevis]|nr:hypothetical protein GJ496_010668 [Pomphorhynchus laevis]